MVLGERWRWECCGGFNNQTAHCTNGILHYYEVPRRLHKTEVPWPMHAVHRRPSPAEPVVRWLLYELLKAVTKLTCFFEAMR
jgi:hypothetical protein